MSNKHFVSSFQDHRLIYEEHSFTTVIRMTEQLKMELTYIWWYTRHFYSYYTQKMLQKDISPQFYVQHIK